MIADRRHDEHPEPPDGKERRCSDEQCRAAREEWFEKTLMPRMMDRIYKLVGVLLATLAGLFLYLADNTITKFELKIKDTYEKTDTHDADIRRLEVKFDSFEMNVLQRLDRNLVEIQKIAQSVGRR